MKNQLIQYCFHLVWQMFFVICLLTSGLVQAQSARPFDAYLHIAAEHNPELQSLFNEYLASLEEVPQVGALPDPQASFAAFVQPVETRVGAQRASVSFQQMFPWFGTLHARERVAAERAKAQFQRVEEAKHALFRQIKEAYQALYYQRRAVQTTQENLTWLASLKKLSSMRFEQGRVSFSDVLKIEMAEALSLSELARLESQHPLLVAKFEQLLNQKLNGSVTLPDSLGSEAWSFSTDSLTQLVLNHNPRLQSLRHERQAHEYAAALVQKEGRPSFTIGGSYVAVSERSEVNVPDNGQDIIVLPQVGLSLPIYRKKYRARQKQAQLQQEATQLIFEHTQDELQVELAALHYTYTDAQRRVALNRQLTDLAERQLKLLEAALTSGQATLEEIIQTAQQRLQYQLEAEHALLEQNNAVYSAHELMGR